VSHMTFPNIVYLVCYGDDDGNDCFTEPTRILSVAVQDSKRLQGTILIQKTDRFDLDKYKATLQAEIESKQRQLEDIS
jgi:hypothetical protein